MSLNPKSSAANCPTLTVVIAQVIFGYNFKAYYNYLLIGPSCVTITFCKGYVFIVKNIIKVFIKFLVLPEVKNMAVMFTLVKFPN